MRTALLIALAFAATVPAAMGQEKKKTEKEEAIELFLTGGDHLLTIALPANFPRAYQATDHKVWDPASDESKFVFGLLRQAHNNSKRIAYGQWQVKFWEQIWKPAEGNGQTKEQVALAYYHFVLTIRYNQRYAELPAGGPEIKKLYRDFQLVSKHIPQAYYDDAEAKARRYQQPQDWARKDGKPTQTLLNDYRALRDHRIGGAYGIK